MSMVATVAGAQEISGDPAAGEKVFNKCKACHVADEAKNKVGPHLVGVIGRTAGTVEDFRYSSAMVEAGEGGLVWDVPSLSEYLAKPRDKVKGTKMAFAGLKKEDEIADVIAYLNEHPAE
ncbi:c-type cytochrome [Oricola cellulosilytica]|uniref:Cytochrome c family protein n=1 Tax=Oricola cellulosilytica TaxID=1429082 RepID=A0A4R0P6B9_9HYPH|nr:cytochrome c family protein [Oricola cellulosilytica]TCD10994.1 cytochrome c family protein [Oricola cellulosilytica]